MKIKCECGGTMRPSMLERFDFSALAGLPIELQQVPGLKCDKCDYVTLPGTVINMALNLVAYALARLPFRLNGAQAKYMRKRLGLTQAALAERMDLSRETVAQWETNAKVISPGNDYILKAMLVDVFIQLGLIVPEEKFLAAVKRDPPSPDLHLPSTAIEEINEHLRRGDGGKKFYKS